jgi:hypothetical protein
MPTSRQNLEQIGAALQELTERQKDFPLYYFEPNPKLRVFHSSKSMINMLSGGNRSGKTEHLVEEACCQSIGYRPWVLRHLGLSAPKDPLERPSNLPEDAICYDASGIRIRVPNTIMIGTGLDLKKGIRETIHPKVMKFLGPEGGPIVDKVYWSHSSTPNMIRLKNGSEIKYASSLQRGLSWEATNYAWYGIDEPIPKRVYSGVRRGAIDQAARITFSFTPLGPNAAWMFRDLYRKSDGRRISTFNISIFDNPWLPPEAVEEFANDPAISDVEKEARLYGKFLHLIDRIYPQFNEEVHIVEAFLPPKEWFIGHVIDPHTVKPWAMAWFTVTPRGELIFFREWPASDFTALRRDTRTPQEYAQLIRQIEGNRPADLRIIDPNYGSRQDTVRGVYIPAVKDILQEFGIFCHDQINDNLQYGEARVRALLSWDTKNQISTVNAPRLYYTECCLNSINSMLYYIAANKSAEDDMPDENKREETHKDFADLTRYAAVSQAAEVALTDTWLNNQPFSSDIVDAYPNLSGYGE